MSDDKKKPFHEVVAERLIEQLEQGTAPWQKPWKPGRANGMFPMNPLTGKRYKGINAIFLMAQGYEDQRWLTYKQAAGMNAQVRRGEKGTPVQYWKFSEEKTKTDESGRPVLDAQGQPVKYEVMLERPRVFFATVFNAQQIDGMPALSVEAREQAWTPVERAEKILTHSGAAIHHSDSSNAFYRPSTDSIHLPERAQFPTADNYYATALHELGHWTGHSSRLARDLSHPFGSEGYAKEELRAEIASMILGDELGIGHDTGQHAAYVKSWIKVLKEDPLEIFRAAADAEKIQGFVLGLEQQQVQEQGVQRAQDEQQQPVAQIGQEVAVSQQTNQVRHAPAFFDSQNALRDAESGELLNGEWQGIAKGENGFLYVGRESGERTFNVLKAKDLPEAEDEASLHIIRESAMAGLSPSEVLGIHEMAQARLVQKRNRTTGIENRVDTDSHFVAIAQERLGHEVDPDWNGRIQIQPNRMSEHEYEGKRGVTPANTPEDAEFWSVYVQVTEGHHWVADFDTEQEARALGDKLALIEALSLANPYEQAASLARIFEDQIRRAPDSTDDDKMWAKEQRKAAESMAMVAEARQSATAEQAQPAATRESPTYINVPYKEKNEAKALGAKWDRQEASWYVPAGVDLSAFQKWPARAAAPLVSADEPASLSVAAATATGEMPADVPAPAAEAGEEDHQEAVEAQKPRQAGREYLAVPYGEREAAKAAGARWDKAAGSWYVGPEGDVEKLARWKPENVADSQDPQMSPVDEFKQALIDMGCDLERRDAQAAAHGGHPIMDGNRHRIALVDDKKGEKSGFYVGHLDGHPAGYIENNRTKVSMKWKSKGYALSDEDRAKIQAEAATKLAARAAQVAAAYERAAKRVGTQLASLSPVTAPTPYLAAKGIAPQAGAWTDAEAQTTYIPAYDKDGKLWTMQYVNADGTKRFAKDSRKEGCFHVVGGQDALASAPAIVIGEGYATMASISEAVGFATVAAFDSGNLPAVAAALREVYPDKAFIVAGDDDVAVKNNPGRAKAAEAARAVGGEVLLPTFAPGEQQGAPKSFSDFNDLATKSVLGKEAVVRQVKPAIDRAIERFRTAAKTIVPTEQLEQAQDAKKKVRKPKAVGI